MSLGKFIADRRKSMYMTQEDMAERMHVSKSAIAKWETDAGIPDRDNLYRLSEILNVTVDDLHRIIENSDAEEKETEATIRRKQLEKMAKEKPDDFAKLLRSWIAED